MINGLLRPRPSRRVHDQPDDVEIPQHPQNLAMQRQPLVRAEALHAIKHQVDVVAQTLRLHSASVGWACGSAIPYNECAAPRNSGFGWFNIDGIVWCTLRVSGIGSAP